MDYIELYCNITPNKEKHTDFISSHLSFIGYESFMITETGINAYISVNEFDLNKIIKFRDSISNFKLKVSYKRIADQNWNEQWEKNSYKPIIIGKKLVVRASFHKDTPDSEIEIIIDPKTAFGTGYHATTYMLLEEALNLKIENKRILDVGTGTGILAILSIKKGAESAFGIDNDPKAITNSQENFIQNKTPNIQLKEGTVEVLEDETFDIIFENIWKNIVIGDLPTLKKHIAKDGIIILSGFYKEDVEQVKEAGEKLGLKFIKTKNKDGWAIVKFQNK